MNLADFINHLASEEVTLWLDSGRLRYRAPRGTLSPDLLDQIRQRKSELIEHLHARAASTRTYPLSFSQRGVWSIERLAPGNAAYHVAVGIRIRGTLDASILEGSIHAVIDRHDPLRTAILLEDDGPVQQVSPR
ncbi:MAG: condensation domain-containing protein, partial [Planctomycetes bacterium]|nr:condensation domain-containing protein [Planctomycetota bacterium]